MVRGDIMVVEMVSKEKMGEIIQALEDLANDRRVPRNVRASLGEAIDMMRSEKETDIVKINTAISIMDEISNDPNIQPYTRTQIWNVVSLLEAVQAEEQAGGA